MANKIQIRRDTAANWTAANSVLSLGEPGLESDTRRRKTGDGTTAWNLLGYDDANTSRLGRAYAGRPLQPVSDRNPLVVGGLVSNGTDTGANSETLWPVTRDTQSVAVVYANIVDWSGSIAANNITVRAAVKVFGGWIPLFFNGKRDVVIEPDGMVVSDPTGAPLAAGSLLPVRTYVTVASGTWPNHTLTDNAAGELTESGTGTTDKTTSGTSITSQRAYAPAPFMVLADPGILGQPRTLVGIGDSILQQQHDAINNAVSNTSTLQWGFLRRYAYPNKVPMLNLGVIGDTARDYAALSGRKYGYRRGASADAAVALVNFGRNDLDQSRTLAQIQ